jgi:hypothetical protein
MMVAWKRVVSVEIEVTDFRIYFYEIVVWQSGVFATVMKYPKWLTLHKNRLI